MNAGELATLTDLKISNMTAKRLEEIWQSKDYRSQSDLINAIRNYAVKGHTQDEVQTKSDRLLAAFMTIIYQHEQAEIIGEGK